MAIKFRKFTYESPSGRKIELQFRDLRDIRKSRIGKFEFVGVDGAYLQHNGMDVREFPCELTLSGVDYQDQLDEMRDIFSEKGIGTLYHPDPTIGAIYAVVDSVEVEQGVVENAGYARIEVTFLESVLSAIDTISRPTDIAEVVALANEIIAEAGSWWGDLITAIESGYLAVVDAIDWCTKLVKDILGEVLKVSYALFFAFNNLVASVFGLADALVFAPLEAIEQIKAMVGFLESSVESIEQRVKAYGDAIKKTFGITDEIKEASPENKNKAIVAQTFTATMMASMAKSVVRGKYTSREQALAVTQELVSTYETFSEKLDDLQGLFSGEQRGGQFVSIAPKMRGLVMRTVFSIQRLAYTLESQRTEVLPSETPLVTLAAKFYKDVSPGTLKRIITDNKLSGRDVVLVPAGRKVIYYR